MVKNVPAVQVEGDEEEAYDPVSLEYPCPLSKSMLWDIQHAYWERGPLAWSSGDVPFLLTTAPVVARSYARLIEGFVTDALAGRFGEFDPDEPVYVIDVGAGNGRLAYYVLRALDREYIAPAQVVYVLADRARANLDFCLAHPKMAQYLESGAVDVAHYDAEKDSSIVLERSGAVLAPGALANPVAGIANYLMCVMPEDAYTVIGGQIYEDYAEVIAENRGVKKTDRTFFDSIFVARYHVPFERGRYGERLDAVVEKVAADRGSDHQFLFPADGIKSLDFLRGLAGGRSMVIVGDRQQFVLSTPVEGPSLLPGDNTASGGPAAVFETQAYRPTELYGMGLHGACMSLPPDFGVLGTAAELGGGEMIHSADLSSGLTIGVVVSGEVAPARELRKRFQDCAAAPAPDDLWYTAHLADIDEAPLEGLIAEMRVSGYDPDVFVKAYPGLERLLKESEEPERSEVIRVIDRVYDMDYKVQMKDDLAFGIAVLFAKGELWREAIRYFEESETTLGPRPQTCFNAAMCHLVLDDRDAALARLDRALELDPGYEPARATRAKLLAGESIDLDA
jgi:hypothetical protein